MFNLILKVAVLMFGVAVLAGFEQQTNDNKVPTNPYAACRSGDGKRWIITTPGPARTAPAFSRTRNSPTWSRAKRRIFTAGCRSTKATTPKQNSNALKPPAGEPGQKKCSSQSVKCKVKEVVPARRDSTVLIFAFLIGGRTRRAWPRTAQ